MSSDILYALILLAAVGHAAWNAIVKNSHDRLLTLVAIRCIGVIFGSVVIIIAPLPNAASWPYLLGAAVVHYLYYGFLLSAYRVGDLNHVYPLARGSAPLIVATLAALFLDERLAGTHLIAVALICSGVLFLAVHRGVAREGTVAFALASGAAIAGYTFLSGSGIRLSGSALAFAGWLELLTGVGMIGVAMVRRRGHIRPFVRTHWRRGVSAGVLSVGSYVIALFAMAYLPLATVAALRETSVVFAALIGTYRLQERFGAQRIAASILVVLGILLLSLPAG